MFCFGAILRSLNAGALTAPFGVCRGPIGVEECCPHIFSNDENDASHFYFTFHHYFISLFLTSFIVSPLYSILSCFSDAHHAFDIRSHRAIKDDYLNVTVFLGLHFIWFLLKTSSYQQSFSICCFSGIYRYPESVLRPQDDLGTERDFLHRKA